MNRRSIGLALAVHALLGVLAVLYVTFTNIDWNAYMEQVVTVFSKGELDYTKIRGDTGPLVYPAGFLWLYWAFTQLSSLRAVQWVFLAMLLATSATLLLLATRLKQGASLPLWQALLLVSSRRVTSIFVLRLFNDAPAALLMLLAVLADSSYLATLLLSAAVSIKMSALLLLPGFGAVLLRRSGWRGAVLHAALFLALQAALGWPFLLSHPSSYLARAFELTRVFEHRWSVNWAFLSPQLFVSPLFSAVLLLLHFLLLLLFASTRWGGIMNLLSGARLPTSAAVATRIQLEALLVGVVCARTLHYQFYAMYCGPLLLLLLDSPSAKFRWVIWLVVETAHIAALVCVYLDNPVHVPRKNTK